MTQKDNKVKKVSKVTTQAVLEKQLQTIFGRLHNLYEANTKLWTEITILQENNNKLRAQIGSVQ